MSTPNVAVAVPSSPSIPSQHPSQIQHQQFDTSHSRASRASATLGPAQAASHLGSQAAIRDSSLAAAEGGGPQAPLGVSPQALGYGYGYPPDASKGGGYGYSGAYTGGYSVPAGSARKSPIFACSIAFGIVATLITLIAQAILDHNQGNSFVGYLWFGILVQILVVAWLSFSTFQSTIYPSPSNQPIAHLSTIVIVLASLAIDRHIQRNATPVQHATAAGWLLILLINFFWVIYLSSPPYSGIVRLVDGYGEHDDTSNIGLGPIKGEGYPLPMTMPAPMGAPAPQATGNGTASPDHAYTIPHPEPNSPLLPPNALRNSGSHRDSGAMTGVSIDGTRRTSAAVSEGRSIDTAGQERLPGSGLGLTAAAAAGSTGRIPGTVPEERDRSSAGAGAGAGVAGDGRSAASGSGTLAQGTPAPGYTSRIEEEEEPRDNKPEKKEVKVWKARALYTYKANTNDPSELSFHQGELLDIIDKSGRWWSAKKPDGSVGIAPSNYLQLL